MDPAEQLLSQFMSASARLSGGLWLMDDRALLQYMSRGRAELERVSVISPTSLISGHGATAVIRVHGVLMKDPWYDDETSTPAIEQAIRLVAGDSQFDSAVYDIDSPGGSSSGITALADAAEELAAKKTVYAQSNGMIASGAYWLAANAHKIFAERMDWIGSIGVRMDVFDVSRWFKNVGIERVAIDTGPLKSTGLFGTEVTEEQRKYLKSLVDDTHEHFKAQVMKGRKMADGEFSAVATGGVFPASTALRLNLIDGIQTLEKTLAAMPRRQTTLQRSKAMNQQTEQVADEPKAATLAELKAKFPKSTAEWRETQIEGKATLSDAAVAYAADCEERLETERKAREEAEKKAAANSTAGDGKGAKAGQVRGNKAGSATGDGSEETEVEPTDFRAMAVAYQKEHKCRWSEACRQIKKKYPEALAAFGGPRS
jgi:signal peptide peptidase SppA